MADGIRWVGLDVHARESTIAMFDRGTGEVITRRVAGARYELLPWLRGLAQRPDGHLADYAFRATTII